MTAYDGSTVARPWHHLLACPVCKSPLEWEPDAARCTSAPCARVFPLVRGVPILINEARSVFSIDQFVGRQVTTFTDINPEVPDKPYRFLRRLVPSNTLAVGREHMGRFFAAFQEPDRRVLVIGAGERSYVGQGGPQLIYSDVHLAAHTDLIADAHDLPFQDESLDAVVAVSVFEHVADPRRCAAEVVRVLKPRGRIYAVSPFMQQVHMGRYDFMRFSERGHRRLWNHFRELEAGISCGPGTALAWSWQYFLLSFSERPGTRKYLRAFAKFTSFFLPYFDYYLRDKAGAWDASSSFTFVGEKLDEPVSDREIIAGYRGLDGQG